MTWTGTAAAHLATRAPFDLFWFFHARPKTFAGVTTPTNLWTGRIGRTITDPNLMANGIQYTFTGVGDGMEIGEILYEAGTNVPNLDVQIYLTPAGETFVKTLDTRKAPCEVWSGIRNPATQAMLGYKRWFKGYIDSLEIDHAEPGGISVANLALVTQMRFGTMSTAGKKSHESQKLRDPTDEIRKYGDLGTKPDDPWGTED